MNDNYENGPDLGGDDVEQNNYTNKQQGESQYNPNEQQQYNPNGQQQYDPNGQQQYNPNGQQQYNPNGQQQYNPNGQQQYDPNGQQQYNPNGQQQYNPNGQQQYNPNGQPTQFNINVNVPPPGYIPKSKIAAGLLGIFLGYFGVHNFYLGYTGKAVAQLLITILTCGVGAAVTSIWGLVEGILILTGSIRVDGSGVPLSD